MAAFKTDGTFTTAAAQGGPNIILPAERDATAYIIEQRYIQTAATFARLALNTAHPSDATAYLVAESDPANIGGGLVEWARRYATIPASRTEYEGYIQTYPGYATPYLNLAYRLPLTIAVVSWVVHDYYLIDPAQTYTDPADIPILQALKPYWTSWGVDYFLDYVATTTTPTLATYQGWVAAGTAIVAENSRLTPWLGNIYERATRYVTAR